ncbi:hypothetical protein PVAND_009958 [Polypedilum vanderplanki]|uniref:Uncharacterized protein n=1 Tax=Polypedilum vanderplanki TaxID=319348 RepID=A0A9J6CEC5_POLVA|nr:hypothetical protein PVAND_009958 [Polypedilum vanderplanki]
MEFSEFMESITVTDEVLEDITFLQNHLRLCIEFHQDISEELYIPVEKEVQNDNEDVKMKPAKCFNLMREFLNDLESEMEDISLKQKFLVSIVTESVNKYCQEFQARNSSMIDRDVACGFINRALENQRMLNKPLNSKNVQLRMSEDEIRQKYQEVREEIRKSKFEIKEKMLKRAILNPLLTKQGINMTCSNQDQNEKKSNKRKLDYSLSEKSNPLLPPEASPISDPTQEQFLKMFGLIKVVDIVKEAPINQRPKRARRGCNKNHKKDFHYGDFHLVEATIAYNQSRSRSVLQNSNKL